ncbi:hypothetical protein HGRIS_014560 [Hohenbuehelia grisea]|uniref:NAD(P)-binding protein n=1 Tax=Hohenbuehelia grisea TaxID=104357 RepID=A0ABR3JV90_9AGAR
MGNRSLFRLLRDQLTTLQPVVKADLTGKVVIVVGANTGIGLETAKHFARMGPARLILACRSETRGSAAIKQLKESTGYDKAELMLVELSQFSSVKAFADKVDAEVENLDLLILNAAVSATTFEVTEDGYEKALQVNYLSLDLISLRLLPKMLKTAAIRSETPRIVVVSSEMHQFGIIPDSLLNDSSALEHWSSAEHNRSFDGGVRYPLTKLLNMLFVLGLSDRLPRTSPTVIVTAVNPGYCISELRRDLGGVIGFITRVMDRLVGRTSEEGARQVVWGALGGGEDEEKLRGAYVNIASVMAPSDFVESETGRLFRDSLWHEMVTALGKADEKVLAITKEHLTTSTTV